MLEKAENMKNSKADKQSQRVNAGRKMDALERIGFRIQLTFPELLKREDSEEGADQLNAKSD